MRRVRLTLLLMILLLGSAWALTVVRNLAYVNQTANIALITLYTPTVTGLYEINFYGRLHACTGVGDTNATATLLWTDTISAQSTPMAMNGYSGTGVAARFTYPIVASAGAPIQFQVVYTPGTDACPYDLNIDVVKE